MPPPPPRGPITNHHGHIGRRNFCISIAAHIDPQVYQKLPKTQSFINPKTRTQDSTPPANPNLQVHHRESNNHAKKNVGINQPEAKSTNTKGTKGLEGGGASTGAQTPLTFRYTHDKSCLGAAARLGGGQNKEGCKG